MNCNFFEFQGLTRLLIISFALLLASGTSNFKTGYKEEAKYFTILLSPGEEWQKGEGLFEQDIREHGKYMKKLFDKGLLIMAGPYVDEKGGLIILKVESKDEALNIIKNDPGVQNKTFEAELREWTVRFNAIQTE